MANRRFRWITFAAASLVVAGTVAGGVIVATHDRVAPGDIAIVNSDTGPVGTAISRSLTESDGEKWTEADPGAQVADHAAVITLPADLSASLTTFTSARPHRAQLTVATNERADTALVDAAVTEVTRRISAAAVDNNLAAVAQARGSMQQAAFTAQLLDAGVRMASGAADQFTGEAQQMVDVLNSARTGAGALTARLGEVHTVLGRARTQADDLAGAFDATGVTLGEISSGAAAMSSGLDQVLPVLRALPTADPRLADAIGTLEALNTLAGRTASQLTGLTELTGSSAGPDIGLGTVLHDAANRLDTVRSQLDRGTALAGRIPQLADEAAGQLQTALQTVSSGVTQMQLISANLTDQTGTALAALPAHSTGGHSALATNLSDPVDVVRQ